MSKAIVKRSSYNLIFGFLGQFVTIAFGILLPRLVLVGYGSEVNGLLNSVNQIFAYFALLEAGVGGVALQSLYKTVGQQSQEDTNAILSAVNKYYKRTSFLYICGIIILAIVYPIVVESTISWWIMVSIIAINGVSPLVNYFIRAKYTLLLQAEGKLYILTNIETTIHIFINVAKIILLMNGVNVVVVQFSAMVLGLIQTGIITLYIRKKYQWIDLRVEPNKDALKQSKNAMVHQIGALVFNNTDTILLTVFAGLTHVSVYAMYALLFGMIKTAINMINDSLKFILGQTYNNNIERFKKMNRTYENLFIALVFALYAVASFFITPFLKLYTRGITDADYFMPGLPILFALVSILAQIRTPANQTISFAKHYKETQGRCIIETIINLVVSIAFVIPFGVYGVLLGTIAALLYRSIDMIIYANRRILKQSFLPTMFKIMVYSLMFVAVLFISNYLVLDLTSYIKIIVNCIPYTLCVLGVFFIVAVLLDVNSVKSLFNNIKKLKRKGRNTKC